MTSRPVQFCYMLLQILHLVTCIFFHEPSFIQIKPSGAVSKDADFGFSIAYQNGTQPNLVIGSPHADLVGQVFSCPIKDVFSKLPCKQLDIDVEKWAPSIREGINPQQKFCLGASIAATPDYILTCAPLWTTIAIKKESQGTINVHGAYGTCFVYNETGAYRFHGTVEQHKKNPFKTLGGVIGGTGWATLVDQTNNLLSIGKPTVIGDIIQVNMLDPLAPTRSFAFGSNKIKHYNDDLTQKSNLGYALAAGNFFSERKTETFYAFSMQNKHRIGEIGFLDKLTQVVNEKDDVVSISAEESGSLFGAALSGADVDADGLADLLVGAPAQAYDENGFEAGALFIYLGGSMETISNNERKKAILAQKDGSRFGTTIATSDIDGDRLPEIFVSAPYENLGTGALYILSGYEVNYKLLKTGISQEVSLSDLPLTQRVQMKNFRSLGYSLQVVPDVDQNGCDELAVGTPPNASVLLFRCIPSITVNVSTKLINRVVAEYDTNFTVKVCVDVAYPEKLRNINVTKLSVVNEINGYGAKVIKPNFDVDLTQKPKNRCEDVVVGLSYNESGYYNFTARLQSNIDTLLLNKDFDSSWVTLSPYSKTEDTLDVTRHCAEKDCTPHLQINLFFAERNGTSDYLLGARDTEKVVVHVRNNGGSAYDGCVRVSLTGARVASVGCGSDDTGAYTCYLPGPLLRHAKHEIEIVLDMSKSTNMDQKLHVEAYLYTNCKHEKYTQASFKVRYRLNTSAISVLGSPHSINITERNINDKSKTITDGHEYTIVNKGSVKWKDVVAHVSLQKESFIAKYKVLETQNIVCEELNETGNTVKFYCTLDLLPNSTLKIIVSTEILIHRIVENLFNAKVETSSTLTLHLKPTNEYKIKRITTEIHYQKELTVGNNKWLIILIAFLVAIIFLTFMVFILYRVGFFKRKTKTRLDSFKESVRRQSVKQSASEGDEASAVPESDDDLEDLDIEVIEDNPFEGQVYSTTTADDAALIVDNKVDSVQYKGKVQVPPLQ